MIHGKAVRLEELFTMHVVNLYSAIIAVQRVVSYKREHVE